MVCHSARIRTDQLHGTCDIETSTHNIKKNFTQHPYGVSHRCVEHGGLYPPPSLLLGGGSSKFDEHGGALNTLKKYLWMSSFDSKVAGYKPASLQIY